MTLEELLALLTSGEITKEQYASVKETIEGAINAEKTKGIESYQKKDREVLKYKQALKAIGYDKDTEDGVDGFVQSLKGKLGTTESSQLTIAELSNKLTELTEAYNNDKLKLQQTQEQADLGLITTELTKALGERFNGSSAIMDGLIGRKRVKVVDGKVAFVNGESVIPFEAGVKTLEEEYKDLLKNQQRPGVNTTPSQKPTTLGAKDINSMSADDGLAALGL